MTLSARILIVDDEIHILSTLKRLFRPCGYETVTCNSAREALELMERTEPFHVVISDYRMPEMNGVEFLTAVRLRSPDTVRIVLSGYADAGSIIAATNEGHIYKFIPKPWDDVFLLDSVADALSYYTTKQERNNLISALESNLDQATASFKGNSDSYRQVLHVYESLIDFMPVGLIGADSDGTIVKMNQYVVSHLKLDSTLIGSTLAALPPPLSSIVSNRDTGIPLPETISLTLNGNEVLAIIKQFNSNGMEGLLLIIVLVPLKSGTGEPAECAPAAAKPAGEIS